LVSDVGLLGWITPKLIAHDQHARGLIARVLGASTQNRQAIYAALAHEELNGIATDSGLGQSAFDAGCERAMRLRNCPASEIICAVYGNVPEGLLGALARCGDRPLKPDHYLQLFGIYAQADTAKVNALRYVGQITDDVLEVVNTLSPILLDAKVVQATADAAKAVQLNDAIACVQKVNSQATDQAIADAVKLLGEKSAVSSIVTRFINRADRLPPQPVAGSDDLRPLDTVPALVAAAKKYQNCLRSYIGRALAGSVAFVEFQDSMLIEFRPMSNGGWLMGDVHIANNERVSDADRNAAEEVCAEHGIPHMAYQRQPPAGWRSIENMLRRYEWDCD
jgi:hypothetical protein